MAMTCPLCSTGITPLHHYYRAVRPSPAHRYFQPRGWSRLCLYEAFEVKHYLTAFFTFFIPVSLFDLESRFFTPTHGCWKPARAGTVKAGRRSALASRTIVSRPRLDRPEHDGTLVVVGMTRPRGARCRARGTRAATLYPVGS